MNADSAGTLREGPEGPEVVCFRPTYFDGHCLYVRRCKSAPRTGLIWHIDAHIDTSYWAEVLARGPKVGCRCSKHHAKLYERARWFGPGPEVGMLVLIPYNTHIGIKDSPFQEYEKFIEESLPIVYYDPSGDADVQ